MTDRGILFSAPMILALLAGRKAMTRRYAWRTRNGDDAESFPTIWQKVRPGDRLWVRENLYRGQTTTAWCYAADQRLIADDWPDWKVANFTDWARQRERPNVNSIHMPRWASRLTLTVTATKMEPAQAITAADAVMEGIAPLPQQDAADPSAWWESAPGENQARTAAASFAKLWQVLHGRDSWNLNPEVVAMSFTVEQRNIDQERSLES
jgi:hypothetical protein